MGYTLTVRAKSSKECQKMLTFMESNFRGWPEVAGKKNGARYASVPMQHPEHKSSIEMTYNSIGWERYYTYTIMQWMVLKIGRLNSIASSYNPYFLYEDEVVPVICCKVSEIKELNDALKEEFEWVQFVNSYGVKIGRKNTLDLCGYAIADSTIKEMAAHDKSYKAFIKKYGHCPTDPSKRSQWLARGTAHHVAFWKGPILKRQALVTDEMKRLTKLWDKEV